MLSASIIALFNIRVVLKPRGNPPQGREGVPGGAGIFRMILYPQGCIEDFLTYGDSDIASKC